MNSNQKLLLIFFKYFFGCCLRQRESPFTHVGVGYIITPKKKHTSTQTFRFGEQKKVFKGIFKKKKKKLEEILKFWQGRSHSKLALGPPLQVHS
jgi:hypothetical protein